MTPEQQAAYVMAQAACAMAELAAMQLENELAAKTGGEPRNGPEDFLSIELRYGINHNAVIGFFR